MRAFIVAEDPSAALRAQAILATQNFICDTAGLDEDGVAIGKLYDHDIILLDLSAQIGVGCELVKQFRAAGVRTPIMVSAAAAQIDLRVRCLGLGADDFLTKPYDNRELVAHVKAVVRRANGHAQSEIRIGQLVVNLDTQSASVADMPLPLTRKEYCVLELLSLRKGIVVTKEAFLNHLYGGMDEPGIKIIDVFVCKLRQKLAEATGGRHYIKTVHGRGYAMCDPAPVSAATLLESGKDLDPRHEDAASRDRVHDSSVRRRLARRIAPSPAPKRGSSRVEMRFEDAITNDGGSLHLPSPDPGRSLFGCTTARCRE
jgi:two-component system cell cycle response regulator CtrA